MAGHSKWSNIKHRKAAQDAKRGKIFTKLIRELTVAARESGPDPETNPRLRAAMDKALSNNMKRDTIDNAVKRGAGDLEGEAVEELTYEGYGPGGAAIMVFCMTDNRNRTVSDVRHAFTRHHGNLGTDGSVAYLFSKRGVFSFAPGMSEDKVMEAALEGGADDVYTYDDGAIDVFCEPDLFGRVKDALNNAGLPADDAEVTQVPATKAELNEDDGTHCAKLIDALEDLDDVQEVYHNAEIPQSCWQ